MTMGIERFIVYLLMIGTLNMPERFDCDERRKRIECLKVHDVESILMQFSFKSFTSDTFIETIFHHDFSGVNIVVESYEVARVHKTFHCL